MALAFEFVALAIVVFAFYRSRRSGGYYDADIYGMTRNSHLRIMVAALALNLLLMSRWLIHSNIFEFIVEAAIALLAVFYVTSFLRGAHEES